MGTFVTAYLAVWLGVSLFVLRLGIRQRRLQRDLEALRLELSRTQNGDKTSLDAA